LVDSGQANGWLPRVRTTRNPFLSDLLFKSHAKLLNSKLIETNDGQDRIAG
jgi:hypothetical protein